MIKANFFGKTLLSEANCLLFPNSKGGFYLHASKNYSKYQGLFFAEGEQLFKTIDQITVNDKIINIEYGISGFIEEYENYNLRYSFLPGLPVVCVENEGNKQILFSFDCREAYDSKIFGRYYDVSIVDDIILVSYKKKNDEQESISEEYELFTGIACNKLDYEIIKKWRDTNYWFDSERNDSPWRAVYDAIKLQAKNIVLASSTKKEEAIRLAKDSFANFNLLINRKCKAENNKDYKNDEVNYAYYLSNLGLRSLIVKNGNRLGIYAGLPWFFQFWTRDSALSTRALWLIGEEDLAQHILFNLLSHLESSGLIPNRWPFAALDSLDGTGLVFFRLGQLLNRKKLTNDEMHLLKTVLLLAIHDLNASRGKDGLIVAWPNETWMDTNGRHGACIEVQALVLAMYQLLHLLSKMLGDDAMERHARVKEEQLKQKIREVFFKDSLLDNNRDSAFRPNVFLAYYFYSELLSKEEWESVFDKTIEKLWLQWGGLSTLDVKDKRYACKHSGMNNNSYHQGDSWFFVNNLAAIVLHRLNAGKYEKQIEAILKASTKEILHSGIFGYHAELSSAEKLESNGCLAQAWSSAFYIELVDELFGK